VKTERHHPSASPDLTGARGIKSLLGAALAVALACASTAPAAPASATSSAAAASNACSNPVLASNLDGWGPLDGSWTSRDRVGDLTGTSWAFDTGGRSFYMPQVSVAAGQSWTFSATDRVVFGSGTAKVGVDWYNAAGQYLNEQTGPAIPLPASTATGGTWTTVSASFVAATGATTAHVLQLGDFGTSTGTNFKATKCNYRQATPSTTASVRYGWGPANASESDEYNATAVDLTKWGLFGTSAGQTTGCAPGYNGHGQRCGSQTTEGGGYLSVTGTADGTTGGLWARNKAFKYGRVEVRERAVPLSATGAAYHAVPLLWPAKVNGVQVSYTNAEIDFAERDVAAPSVGLFVHHDGTQTPCSFTTDSTQFHNYAIDWEPTSVTWYIDAVQICTVNAAIPYFDNTNGGAQLDMFPNTGTTMQAAREDVDWIHMFPASATQFQ